MSVCKQKLVFSRHVALQLDGQHVPRQDAHQHMKWTSWRAGTISTIACMSSSFCLHARGSLFVILSQTSSSSFLSQFNLRPGAVAGCFWHTHCSTEAAAHCIDCRLSNNRRPSTVHRLFGCSGCCSLTLPVFSNFAAGVSLRL